MASHTALALILSKDRALQLEATLNSLLRHATETSGLEWVVLYRASSPRFESQYERLALLFRGRIGMTAETDFRQQVTKILKEGPGPRALQPPAGPSTLPVSSSNGRGGRSSPVPEYVIFLVDDVLFTRSLSFNTLAESLSSNPDALGFSLRLGRNTKQCYALKRTQSLPDFQQLPHGVLKFNWRRADGDFGYPLEISSSMYRLETISTLIEGLDFNNPNSLESQMAMHAKQFASRFPALLCAETSLAFSNPLNRVQETFANRSGDSPAYSAGALADRFDRGQRINVQALDGFVPAACHQEVQLAFETRVG